MSTRFFTNTEANTLLAKLEGVFSHNSDIEHFDALVGYLRASGYFALRPHLKNVPKIRILVGIDVDEIVADYHKRGLLFLADPTKAINDFHERLKKDIQEAAYRTDIEEGITQFVNDVVDGKLSIRAHPTKRLHAKIYIFRPVGFCEHKAGAVIAGSSNLTAAGLGVHEQARNYEFNVLLHDYPDVKFASEEFDKLWYEAQEILPKTVIGVRDSTYLGASITPYELYYKFLAEYFGYAIDYDPNSIADLPEGFKKLSYQADAVTLGYRLLERHNGFFLADVVGLGKTIIAALIAKKFFFYNGFPEHRSHTLVIVPPAVEDIWRETLDKFRIDNYKIVRNGSLGKVEKAEKYDLVIVDEAHKFRNDTSDAFDELQRICKTGSMRKLPDGSTASKRVILVTATPLNNSPQDIRNLISLFQDLKCSSLSIANLQHFFAQREREFREAKLLPNVEDARKRVIVINEMIRTKVLEEVTVRRTRTDLRDNEEYSRDIAANGVVFPEVQKPKPILYGLPGKVESLYDKTIRVIAKPALNGGLSYNRYKALSFMKDELKSEYQNADRISLQLATIMRTLLVKRLDSSFSAFTESLRRFHNATEMMVKMFEKGAIYIAPKLNVTEFLLDGREDELIALISEREESDPTIRICKPSDFSDNFLAGLKDDMERIAPLLKEWVEIVASGNDPKFDEFNRRLQHEFFNPDINHEGRKLVVFSESKETVNYLKNRLASCGFKKLITVDSSNRASLKDVIAENFDANYKGRQKNDYEIMISTEVLSEGINLHRANVMVNYDTPWNATRLMQRIGRLNRIGSAAARIHVYNFFPTSKVDDDIELKKKAIMKLQAFHTALGEDSQIYSTDEEVDSFGLFEKTPEEQERDERLVLLMELRAFRKADPERFRRIAKLPPRCRVGRLDSDKDFSTVAFIRNSIRDAFYRIKESSEPDEITFLEAAADFKARAEDEKAIPLHSMHHAQVNSALEDFAELVLEESLSPKAIDTKQGPNERRALAYLDAFLSFDFISDDERKLILQAKIAIGRARFHSLQREINTLQRDAKKSRLSNSSIADKLISILKGFPLDRMDSVASADVSSNVDTTPEIILSESFSAVAEISNPPQKELEKK